MMMPTDLLANERDRLLVVCDPGNLAGLMRRRYPGSDVMVSNSYLAGIAALAERPARGILVGVDPSARKLDGAVAGLRKAAGRDSRVVLCCRPSGEPAAREAVKAGADDYVIYPPQGDELDEALGMPARRPAPTATDAPTDGPSWDELNALAGVLANLGEGQQKMLERFCRLLSESMRTPHVRVMIGNRGAHVGDLKIEPSLSEPIVGAGRILGQILVGPRRRSPFASAEVEKLRHYARLMAHLIDAAEQQQHWHTLALTDSATGLPNRRYLMQALESILQRAEIEQFCVTVLIFDLDGFKHFNDTYGHAAGDEIISRTGRLFQQHCRRHDIVARYAGDEFVVVFWDAEKPRIAGSRHPSSALSVLKRFKKALATEEFPGLGADAVGRITISGGLATFPWDARKANDLLEKADQALLLAKRDGKNRIYLFENQKDNVQEEGASSSRAIDERRDAAPGHAP